jgi:hypothetical protein
MILASFVFMRRIFFFYATNPSLSGYDIGSGMRIGLGCGYEEEQQSEIVFGPGSHLMSNRTERRTEQGTAAHTTEPEPVLSGVGLLEAVTSRVAELQIDEKRIFIAKIAALLSPSVLGAAPGKTKASHQPTTFKRRLFGSVRGSRQSSWL